MKYNSPIEKAVRKSNIARTMEIRNDIDSKPEYRDPKAYKWFKSLNTDYSGKRRCAYGDKTKSCNPGCRFWNSCKHGKHESEWKGDVVKSAQSNTETENSLQE